MGSNLENCIAGSSIYKITNELNEKTVLELANNEIDKFWKSFEWNQNGIYLVAPTLGELDAAYNLLSEESIPIMRGNITATESNLNKKFIEKYSTLIEQEKFQENRVIMFFHSKPLSSKVENDIIKNCQENNIH